MNPFVVAKEILSFDFTVAGDQVACLVQLNLIKRTSYVCMREELCKRYTLHNEIQLNQV